MPTLEFRQWLCNHIHVINFNASDKYTYYETFNYNEYDANNIIPSATSSFSSSYSNNNSNVWLINQKNNDLLQSISSCIITS